MDVFIHDKEDDKLYIASLRQQGGGLWSGWVEAHPDIRAEAESPEALSKVLKTRLLAKLDAESNAWDAEIAEDALSGALQAMIDEIRKGASNEEKF